MSYAFQDELIGLPGIRQVDSAPRSPAYPGMLAHAVDPVLGGGEFLYLPGVTNAVLGSLVTYNQLTPSTVLAATGAKTGSPVAVAMAPIGAGQYGWFQISGNALVAKTAGAGIAAGASVGVSATPGAVATSAGGAATAGALTGAVCNAIAASGDVTANVGISRPVVN